jgi:hypothetical protein
MAQENLIERRLVKHVERLGGVCLKLPAIHVAGIPDRLCLLPGGVVVFVELKAPGEKPRKLQVHWHKKLRGLGFRVDVVDSVAGIENVK